MHPAFRLSLIVLLLAALPASAASLEEVRRLARSGATGLALQLMDESQPGYARAPEQWRAWEQERLYILSRREDWAGIVSRLRTLPADLPPGFTRPATIQYAEALLALSREAQARRVLLDVLLEPVAVDDPFFLQARELVLRSYIQAGDLADAEITLRRYLQDYPQRARDWLPVQARILLQTGKAAEAAGLLEGRDDPESQLLRWLAGLKTGQATPAAVLEKSVATAVAKQTPEEQRRLAWLLAAEAAREVGNQPARISALEKALVLPRPRARVPVLQADADSLWTAYLALGRQLGNELRLVVGDDQAWFLAASNRYDRQPIHARALFAVVAFNALQPEQRDVAHWQFASLLREVPDGEELLKHLYVDSERFAGVQQIPAGIRYLLVDYVLSIPDIPLASKLMAGLEEPPPKTDPVDWHLRRARVLLLGGAYREGVAALDALLQMPTPPDTDRFLQVVFDLQTLGLHQDALRYFQWLLAREDVAPERKREILYWAGDSSKALDRPADAARYYLNSAIFLDPVAMDPWAQTARYQAARALAEAGYFADARRILTGLLNATRDPARQAVLRRELQQLELQAEPAGVRSDAAGAVQNGADT